MKVKYYLARPDAKQETAIFATASYDGHRLKLYIGEAIDPKHWNPKTQTARNTPRFIEHPEFNRRLEKVRSIINTCFLKHKNETGSIPAPDVLKTLIAAALGRTTETKLDFKGFFENFIHRQKDGLRVGEKGAIKAEAAKHYNNTLNTILAFKSDTDFKNITLAWYNDFLAYMQKEKFALNYIGIHIQRLKTVLAEAEAGGYPVHHDYKSKYFRKVAEAADNIALTEKELQDIAAADFAGNKRLEAVRDLFIIGCYTGLRFSDFSRLTENHIKEGFITIDQQKTGNPVVIPVHPIVAGIVHRYGGKLPPAISNQKSNDYLKEICQLVPALQVAESKTTTKGGQKVTVSLERWQMVSSHTARRTFATIQYHKGLPSLTIMAITGHKTEKQFLAYIKVSPKEHAQKLKQLWADDTGPVMKAV